MHQLRVLGITNLVEKFGMTIKNVFIRSYAITKGTLPCASDTDCNVLLLGKHRDGFSDTRSVTAYESTQIPHALATFTANPEFCYTTTDDTLRGGPLHHSA